MKLGRKRPKSCSRNGAPMIHIRRFTGVILLFVLAAMGPRSAFAANASSQRQLDRALLEAVKTGSLKPQRVIVRAKAGQLAAVRNWLKAHGDVVESEKAALNALSTQLPTDHLRHAADLSQPRT